MTEYGLVAAAELFAGGSVLLSLRDGSHRARSRPVAAFNSVSLSPPIVMCVMRAEDAEGISEDQACAFNVLTARQAALFEHGGRKALHWQPAEVLGVPCVTGAAATFEGVLFCRRIVGEDVMFLAQLAGYEDVPDGELAVVRQGSALHLLALP